MTQTAGLFSKPKKLILQFGDDKTKNEVSDMY